LIEKLVPTSATSRSPVPAGTVGTSPPAAAAQSGRLSTAVTTKDTAITATMARRTFSITP
jgi:hypothetical protein